MLNLHAVYGNPYSVLGFLELLEDGHLKNISEIYYLLDFFTFDGVERAHQRIEYKTFLDRFMYRFSRVGNYFWVAISTVKANLMSDYSYYITIDGSRKNVSGSEREPEFRLIHGLKLNTNITDDTLEQLGMIAKFCKKNNLEITYFTPPLPLFTLKHYYPFEQYSHRLKVFLRVVPHLHDFTRTKELSENTEYFSNYSHVNTAGVQVLIQMMKEKTYQIDESNIDEHLEQLRNNFAIASDILTKN